MDPALESEPRPDTAAAGNALLWMTGSPRSVERCDAGLAASLRASMPILFVARPSAPVLSGHCDAVRLLRGVDEWSAKVPVQESRTAWSVVDGLARSYVTDGKCEGIEQARPDTLMDLIHARATGEITVHLTVRQARSRVRAPQSMPPAGRQETTTSWCR